MIEKVLLDTDIGSDIDDALCLSYLLAQPDCELMGITTVSGQPVERAKLASAICRHAGQDIPIYPGAEMPYLCPQHQPNAQQAARLTNWDHTTDFPKGAAIEFMRDTIRKNPGKITLLAVGPMTNIATLFKADEEIPSLLKQLVLMCGTFTNGGGREWNAICDPHATAVTYRTPVMVHRSIGLNVTTQLVLDREEMKQRASAPLLAPAMDFASVWFEQTPRITFHDPLTAVSVFDDEVCTYARGDVSIELLSNRTKGVTYWDKSENGAHQAAMTVDKQRFFDEYFGVIERYRK